MMYECGNCKKHFIHPAKITQAKDPESKATSIAGITVQVDVIELTVCPFCHSLEYTEATTPEGNVQNVYIYDLTTGEQSLLDTLLAQGYVIVNRYSKQYHLEKPKVPQQ